jgi:hypothetical protein
MEGPQEGLYRELQQSQISIRHDLYEFRMKDHRSVKTSSVRIPEPIDE